MYLTVVLPFFLDFCLSIVKINRFRSLKDGTIIKSVKSRVKVTRIALITPILDEISGRKIILTSLRRIEFGINRPGFVTEPYPSNPYN